MKKYLVLLAGFFFLISGVSSAKSLTIHYNRADKDYSDWNIWYWDVDNKTEGKAAYSNSADTFGAVYTINLEEGSSAKKLGFLPRKGDWKAKDMPERIYTVSDFPEIYMLENDSTVYTKPPASVYKITNAYLDSPTQLRIVFTRPVNVKTILGQIAISADGKPVVVEGFELIDLATKKPADQGRLLTVKFKTPNAFKEDDIINGKWLVKVGNMNEQKITPSGILYTDKFYYSGELGVINQGKNTVVSAFAPAAQAVALLVKDNLKNDKVKEYGMKRGDKGVWSVTTRDNLSKKYYRFKVTRDGETVEGIDPYAKSTSHHDGWGYITDDKTPVEPSPVFDNSENIIYELHLRDISIAAESNIKNKGKYLGLAQDNTFMEGNEKITTGLSHLKELGVNTLHILPFQDFENNEFNPVYDWGYMPVHFNSPEGWYATRPDAALKVAELKEMISALHKAGMKVIMDVVYNHTAETSPNTIFNFNGLAKNYYYRTRPDGTYYNGSGCGNEFKSESPMGRKFMIDSLVYWAKNYKVDGFRFDLMGLIDLETIETAMAELKKVNPNIFIYGEPWAADETPIDGIKKGSQRGKNFSVFNDNFRDALKGSVFNLQPGFVQAAVNREQVKRGIEGSINDFTSSPLETINYVSCHDNHTLWDRITLTEGVSKDVNEQIAMDKLANAVILTSQGIVFLHAGEDFLRTKYGEHNSYNLGDHINEISWKRKERFFDVFEYYKSMIAMRKEHPAFRMKTAQEVKDNLKFYENLGLEIKEPLIAYTLNGTAVGDRWEEIVVIINPLTTHESVVLPQGEYIIASDGKRTSLSEGLGMVDGEISVRPLSLTVLYKTAN